MGENNAGGSSSLTAVQDNLDRAMNATRDEALHNIQGKTNNLQNTSTAFSRQAKMVRWQQQWQQIQCYVLVALLILWLACLIIFWDHLIKYLIVSSVAVVVSLGA